MSLDLAGLNTTATDSVKDGDATSADSSLDDGDDKAEKDGNTKQAAHYHGADLLGTPTFYNYKLVGFIHGSQEHMEESR